MGLLSSLAKSLFGKPERKDESHIDKELPEDREEGEWAENSRGGSDNSEDDGDGSGDGGDE
jgi:hypothetical protein